MTELNISNIYTGFKIHTENGLTLIGLYKTSTVSIYTYIMWTTHHNPWVIPVTVLCGIVELTL